jgi:hypothetical protein
MACWMNCCALRTAAVQLRAGAPRRDEDERGEEADQVLLLGVGDVEDHILKVVGEAGLDGKGLLDVADANAAWCDSVSGVGWRGGTERAHVCDGEELEGLERL